MKQRLLIALLTILVLGAGYGAGVWTERHSCKVPKPPALLGELSNAKREPASAVESTPAPDAAKLATQIEQLKPEIEAFRMRLSEIDRELDREIETILRPDQLEVFRGIVKKFADLRAQENAASSLTTPLTSEEIVKLQQKPLYKMLAIVVVPMRLEWNVKDLKLDDQQKEELRKILVRRREKFLALVDSSPPPSLTLSRLAPMASRLVETAAEDSKDKR